jgi:hypothetical protein
MREPYKLTEEMWTFLAHHYRLRTDADEERPASAWTYRRSQLVRPQKWGKGPFSAAMICAEAVGPVVFAGWDASGEPVGRPWPTPLIQITAASEDQTDNVYRVLQPMIEYGKLADLIPDTGETRINLPGGGRIDPVTSKARSRLGQRVTFVVQDETGTWTKSNGGQLLADTQRRGLAGMGGRAIETTNAWDPAEGSVAQQTAESSAKDIYRDHLLAPVSLSYTDRRDRRRIHRVVYGDSWWVDLDRIDAEASELLERDPQQAERFFGNRLVVTGGSWLPAGVWDATERATDVPEGTQICLGFDGSRSGDWTVLRAETIDGHRFTPTYGPDNRATVWNPVEWDGEIPRTEIHAAIEEICERYEVTRAYCDPPHFDSEIDDWALRYGDDVFMKWATYRPVQMFAALDRALTDLTTGRSTHDACPWTSQHVANARKLARPGDRYLLGKPNDHQKIDAAMADVLAHEAASDARAAGWDDPPSITIPRRIR